jgi:hypothetical protein
MDPYHEKSTYMFPLVSEYMSKTTFIAGSKVFQRGVEPRHRVPVIKGLE